MVKKKTGTKKTKKPVTKARVVKIAPKKSETSDLRIGILGGAFDPVHVGHLNSAMTVKQKLGLDKVYLMPNHTPPHRETAVTKPEDRLAMVEAAVKPYKPELDVEGREVDSGGVSYTFESLTAISKKCKSQNIYFIMGADAFLQFHTWKNFEKLLTLANFVVTTRPGFPLSLSAVDLPDGLGKYVKAADNNKVILTSGFTITKVELEDVNISSSDLRKKMRSGQNISKYVPRSVAEYIHDKSLYKKTSPFVDDYKKLSVFCAQKAFDKKALDLKIYDLRSMNTFTDFSVICSATSTRHAMALAEGVVEAVKEEYGLSPLSVEGLRHGQWVLVDFGAVIFHVFEDTIRNQYQIEQLWHDCDLVQAQL